MKRFAIAMVLISAAPFGALANTRPAGKESKECMIGVTGINADIRDGVLRVTKVTPNTPAAGKLQAGSVEQVAGGGAVDIGQPPADRGEDWLAVIRRR